MNKDISKELFEKAQRYIPGGVNSPVRAWNAVGGYPPFIKRGEGAYIYDEDGNCFVDYFSSWGPLILGHCHRDVVQAAMSAIEKGTSFGAPTEIEVKLCETIVRTVPSIEMVRLVNSGTEAVMSAIRLARAFTGKKKIVKFEGCYHGHWDPLLVKAGSGLATANIRSSAGVPEEIVKDTVVIPYNCTSAVQQAFDRYGDDIACVIVEPVAGNMGTVLPVDGFLQSLREITKDNNSLLIFDEVITGYRISLGGAQERFKVFPDITCLGKIIGGGLPVGAYGGRREIMEKVSPLGDVYQAGTLSGNPLACACGVATLEVLLRNNIYDEMEERTKKLCNAIEEIALSKGIKIVINKIASMFTIFFTEGKRVENYETVSKCNGEMFRKFFSLSFEQGLYFPPSPYETSFLSAAHNDDIIDKTISSMEKIFKGLKS
ncbi:MAG: glutamate-1-semialdehyde-2,1-aminomutase [Candidatus Schekmanbacteria bacterium]|nr:MAG: glutamate-1-semialdehyde-2,1-aminomutase [Candidatus Schekmanbacteria bacterium]